MTCDDISDLPRGDWLPYTALISGSDVEPLSEEFHCRFDSLPADVNSPSPREADGTLPAAREN